jgi:hypothetical protein
MLVPRARWAPHAMHLQPVVPSIGQFFTPALATGHFSTCLLPRPRCQPTSPLLARPSRLSTPFLALSNLVVGRGSAKAHPGPQLVLGVSDSAATDAGGTPSSPRIEQRHSVGGRGIEPYSCKYSLMPPARHATRKLIKSTSDRPTRSIDQSSTLFRTAIPYCLEQRQLTRSTILLHRSGTIDQHCRNRPSVFGGDRLQVFGLNLCGHSAIKK